MSARRLSRLVLLAFAGAVLLHCVLGIVVLATAGRLAWAAMAEHGHSPGKLGAATALLGAAWLLATVAGLAVAVRLTRAGRLSL